MFNSKGRTRRGGGRDGTILSGKILPFQLIYFFLVPGGASIKTSDLIFFPTPWLGLFFRGADLPQGGMKRKGWWCLRFLLLQIFLNDQNGGKDRKGEGNE